MGGIRRGVAADTHSTRRSSITPAAIFHSLHANEAHNRRIKVIKYTRELCVNLPFYECRYYHDTQRFVNRPIAYTDYGNASAQPRSLLPYHRGFARSDDETLKDVRHIWRCVIERRIFGIRTARCSTRVSLVNSYR